METSRAARAGRGTVRRRRPRARYRAIVGELSRGADADATARGTATFAPAQARSSSRPGPPVAATAVGRGTGDTYAR